MTDLDALHAHQKEHHRIVTGILRYISHHADVPFAEVRQDFIEGLPDITILFWEITHDTYPGRFVGVSWCHGCRRFSLDEYAH